MAKGLDEAYADVKAFQIAFGGHVAARPRMLERLKKQRRIAWMREEIEELATAETVEEQADAVIDLVYFAMGCLVEMGVPPSGVWSAVHKANMAKLWPDGVHTNSTGKVVKPAGWNGPDEEIREYIAGLAPVPSDG
jgi:Uncharacterized protein conserved in bacteria